MNGKIRVSIVATALKGSETKPYLNLVNNNQTNGSNINRNYNYSDNLFKNHLDNKIVNSIDGATAFKLDESYEIKNNEEQNALIDSYENKEEDKIAKDLLENSNNSDEEVPPGVSIESASYMENNFDGKINESLDEDNNSVRNIEHERVYS